jgi:hypothetical protein
MRAHRGRRAYTLQPSDVGSTIRALVTASNPGGQASASSSATVVVPAPATVPSPVASTTTLVVSPAAAVTNQTVTIIATVTSAASSVAPSGTMTFENAGARAYSRLLECSGLPE